MFSDFLALGGVEIANSTRLRAYLESVGSPLTSIGTCLCPTLTPQVLGEEDGAYTNPADDEAPWYDEDVPESAEFAGFMVLSVDGLDTNPVARTVTTAVSGGASLGPLRIQPRTIVVTGILLGSTCCGVEYGLHWLSEALRGCAGGLCDGDCMSVYACCPGEGLTAAEFNRRHRRTLRRVALTDGPRVVSRVGDGCTTGECQIGADIITVEFTLTAATPWLWTDTTDIFDAPASPGASTECIKWCVVDPAAEEPAEGCGGCCRVGNCGDPSVTPDDPSCVLPPTPTAPESCYCLPLAAERVCYELDLTDRPAWSVDVPMITVRPGSKNLERVTISIYERTPAHEGMTCAEISDEDRCEPHSVYHIQFAQAGTALILDGQVGRAVVECGDQCETSGDVYGHEGGPPSWKPLDCGTYCVCIETDALRPPADDAEIVFGVSGRGL
ncbi:hypothetical protein [Streptomyces sp. NPDC057250]|uniref:hypothetical protein n=1 Tax=Streptomyces sp. NPDC057250 TaxID=3346068 RepID=UPI00363692AB